MARGLQPVFLLLVLPLFLSWPRVFLRLAALNLLAKARFG